MAAELETGEGVVTKSEDDAIKLDGWKSYLKYGNEYDSYKPEVGQKVRVHYRPWPKPNSSTVYYYLSEVEVLGPPPDGQPSPAGPGPAVGAPRGLTYEETHGAAEARVKAESDGMDAMLQEPSGGVEDVAALMQPKPGDYAYRDLSIQRQNRLNVAKDCLIANLAECPPDQKAGRMITPELVKMFEEQLVDGAEPMPPEDLPGGP